jgi:catechol 2,3-dioxygenase-like lactoylglutathione lyase family enzyme
MLEYVTIGALDVAAALPFYDGFLGALGYERKGLEEGWAEYGPPGAAANVFIGLPYDGQPARGGNGIMLAFRAQCRAAVNAAHAGAMAGGGTDEGAPGGRPPESTDYYAAYVRDPTGNKLSVFTRSPT